MTTSDATKIATNLWLDIIQYHRQGDSLGQIERWLTNKNSANSRDYWSSILAAAIGFELEEKHLVINSLIE